MAKVLFLLIYSSIALSASQFLSSQDISQIVLTSTQPLIIHLTYVPDDSKSDMLSVKHSISHSISLSAFRIFPVSYLVQEATSVCSAHAIVSAAKVYLTAFCILLELQDIATLKPS